MTTETTEIPDIQKLYDFGYACTRCHIALRVARAVLMEDEIQDESELWCLNDGDPLDYYMVEVKRRFEDYLYEAKAFLKEADYRAFCVGACVDVLEEARAVLFDWGDPPKKHLLKVEARLQDVRALLPAVSAGGNRWNIPFFGKRVRWHERYPAAAKEPLQAAG